MNPVVYLSTNYKLKHCYCNFCMNNSKIICSTKHFERNENFNYGTKKRFLLNSLCIIKLQ